MAMTGNETVLQKTLDAMLLELAGEHEPIKRDVILGKMIKEQAYVVEKNCNDNNLNTLKLNLTIAGLVIGLSSLATVVMWLITVVEG